MLVSQTPRRSAVAIGPADTIAAAAEILAADLQDLARPVTAEVLFGHHDSPVPAEV